MENSDMSYRYGIAHQTVRVDCQSGLSEDDEMIKLFGQ